MKASSPPEIYRQIHSIALLEQNNYRLTKICSFPRLAGIRAGRREYLCSINENNKDQASPCPNAGLHDGKTRASYNKITINYAALHPVKTGDCLAKTEQKTAIKIY
jgi:hypothetical protein